MQHCNMQPAPAVWWKSDLFDFYDAKDADLWILILEEWHRAHHGKQIVKKCMSSATEKPRSVRCAQCSNVVRRDTMTSFTSTAVKARKAKALHQQTPRMSMRET